MGACRFRAKYEKVPSGDVREYGRCELGDRIAVVEFASATEIEPKLSKDSGSLLGRCF